MGFPKDDTSQEEDDLEVLKPGFKKGINWYRGFMLLLSALGPISVLALKYYLEGNFVTAPVNAEAWRSQIEINGTLTRQLNTLVTSDAARMALDTAQDQRLNNLEGDIREQRRVLTDSLIKK